MTVELINPANGLPLITSGDSLTDANGNAFPIIGGVPRVCDAANYSDSFGFQWNRFERTQLDGEGEAGRQSATRFFAETGWSAADLDGRDLLEVGSGAGRFSRIVLEQTKANLWSVDYSSAVEANLRNNRSIAPGRFHLFQASVYEMPFADGSFDKVFCLGVLQHTPDVAKTVEALVSKAKPGGEIVVDFYAIHGWWTKLHAKYLLRPITRRLSQERLLKLIEGNADRLVGTALALRRAGLGSLTRFLPLVDLSTLPAGLSPEQRREWAVLDTFDMFSPTYDQPQRVGDVARMFERSGAEVRFAGYVDVDGSNTAVVRAIRK